MQVTTVDGLFMVF